MPATRTITEKLQDIVRIAQSSRDFFVAAYPHVAEPELRTAFAYISDVKARLIADMTPWTPQEPCVSARKPDSDAIERLYADARALLGRRPPEQFGDALSFGEDQLLKRVERAFDEVRLPALRQLLRSYQSQLAVCRQAMWRLNGRMAA